MAVTHRTATLALALQQSLAQKPYTYDFYWAMRAFEAYHPGTPRLGESLRPADDAIRLGQEASLAFAPSTISSFIPGKEGRRPRMEVLFFGLFGPNAPLPLHLTEYARDRVRNADDPTFSRFADLFHHRFLSLFYRAWANAQPAVNHDRPEQDRFATYLGATCGYGMPSLRGRDDMPDLAKLHYAGWISNQVHNADGLQSILTGFFRLPVSIEQFVGHWMTLPEDTRCRLGESPETGSLGMTAVIGAQVWDCQHKFRIVLGPLELDDYRRMLPGGESFKRLTAIVKNYVGDELHWDLNLILKKEQVPPIRLGREGQLGWTTCLSIEPPTEDPRDLMLNPFFKP
ncbi:type VI secretion protein, VC_A0111 family [endosymbiont of Ridgeia piscesae]|uniref:Type VI secretion protein, VC_A0111 family n=2 Tax=endosymbiont of Ridgeia piscesae TaxID=54398 RepID=A0A0T5Z0Q5_9GAMM|nr:type VI secretion system baseplate subunit TssG [endosymbiont of Ridgeia piscesae]KRT56440.1 type VI secretion protein, VC_A0111 family [endosymbiont of Ridgeia piscesae]